MSGVIKLPDKTEFLTEEEVEQLTGRKMATAQTRWLDAEEWEYTTNAAGRPIISRLYCQIRLMGLKPSEFAEPVKQKWRPNFTPMNS